MKKKEIKNKIEVYKKEAESLMSEEQLSSARSAINKASLAAAGVGAGLAQIPGSDAPIIVGLQIAMIQSIGKTFNRKVSKTSAESIIGTGLATLAGRGLSQVLVGWIPLGGNVINAGTAALITQMLGWYISSSFAKDYYKELKDNS